MRKIVVIAIVGIIFGVITAGAGVTEKVDPELVKFMRYRGYIALGMESNASFLAPMPINYSLIPTYIPTCEYNSPAISYATKDYDVGYDRE